MVVECFFEATFSSHAMLFWRTPPESAAEIHPDIVRPGFG